MCVARVLTPITVKAPHGTASIRGDELNPHLDLPSTLAKINYTTKHKDTPRGMRTGPKGRLATFSGNSYLSWLRIAIDTNDVIGGFEDE